MRIHTSLRALALLAGTLVLAPGSSMAQAPRDQVHLSVSLGGYLKFGVGFTHWLKEHHSVEFTAFPMAYPWEGFHFDLKAGYSWIPSDEIWRAKLGGNVTLLVHKPQGDGGWFTPLLNFTPGLSYHPENERCVRVDAWISYYLTEKVFAPTGLEILYGLRR